MEEGLDYSVETAPVCGGGARLQWSLSRTLEDVVGEGRGGEGRGGEGRGGEGRGGEGRGGEGRGGEGRGETTEL